MGIFGRKPNLAKMEQEKDVQGLIKALRHKEHRIRIGATLSLGRLSDKRAIEPLIETFNDQNWLVRVGAAEALGRIGKPAVEILVQHLTHIFPTVRLGAAEALGKIGDKRTIKPLVEVYRKETSSPVKQGILKALKELGGEKAVNRALQT